MSGWRRVGSVFLASLEAIRKLLVNVAVIVLIALLTASIVHEFEEPAPTVDPISVPKRLAELGYTGDFVAARIIDKANDLETEIRAQQNRLGAAAAGPMNSSMTATVPETGASVAEVVEVGRHLFGLPERRVSGGIVIGEEDGQLVYQIVLRMHGPERRVTIGKFQKSVDDVIIDGAKQLTELLRPCALVAFRLQTPPKDEADRFMYYSDLGQVLAICIKDKRVHDYQWALLLAGRYFRDTEDYDIAVQAYRAATKFNSTEAYSGLAWVLCKKGDVSEGAKALQKASTLAKKPLSEREAAANCEEVSKGPSPHQ